MSERDLISERAEAVGIEEGIVGIKCRLMHCDAFEQDGEHFPAYDEYEVRVGCMRLCMGAEGLQRLDKDARDEFLREEIRGAFL